MSYLNKKVQKLKKVALEANNFLQRLVKSSGRSLVSIGVKGPPHGFGGSGSRAR